MVGAEVAKVMRSNLQAAVKDMLWTSYKLMFLNGTVSLKRMNLMVLLQEIMILTDLYFMSTFNKEYVALRVFIIRDTNGSKTILLSFWSVEPISVYHMR